MQAVWRGSPVLLEPRPLNHLGGMDIRPPKHSCDSQQQSTSDSPTSAGARLKALSSLPQVAAGNSTSNRDESMSPKPPSVPRTSSASSRQNMSLPPVPQTQLKMRRVNSTPCVSSSFSDTNDPIPLAKNPIPSAKSTDVGEGPPAASPKHIYLTDSPHKLASPHFNFMQASPTLNTVASTVLMNFPTNNEKISTEAILKSEPPTPFPELDTSKIAASCMMSPGSVGEQTPRSSDPAFSWFNVNSPTLMKSPKVIGNIPTLTGNFFSDAADLGFAEKSPAYLKQNSKLPFSPVSTLRRSKDPTDVIMEAEREIIEDDDMTLLLKLAAQSGGTGSSRTPLQRNIESTATTSDILTASSLHLPHIPSVSSNNAFRASSMKDAVKGTKSDFQPPLLKPSGSFHSTKITRMDSYGTSGVAKLTISNSKSGDAGESLRADQSSHPADAVVSMNSSAKQPTSNLPPSFVHPTHQTLPFHPPAFLPMPPMGSGCYRYPPIPAPGAPIVPRPHKKQKSPVKKRPSKKAKTPAKKGRVGAYGADGDAGLLRGVTMRPSGKWQAQLYYAGKSRYIGVFDTRENAATAYEIARQKLKKSPGSDVANSNSQAGIEEAVTAARKAAFEGVNKSIEANKLK